MLRGLVGDDVEVNRALEQMLIPSVVVNGDDGGWNGRWSVGGSDVAPPTASGLGLGSPRSMLLSLAPSPSINTLRGKSPAGSSPQADAQERAVAAGKLSRLGSR